MVRADDALADLERALATAPADESLLAVYADALLARGDPRGEILALEQHLAELDATAAAGARRRIAELTREVLGDDLAPEARLVRGFLHLTLDPAVCLRLPPQTIAELALRGPAGRSLQRLRIDGDTSLVAYVLALVAARARPNLVELAIAVPEPGRSLGEFDLTVVAPALRRFVLEGEPVIAAAPHAQLEDLTLTGTAAMSWGGRVSRLPAVSRINIRTSPPDLREQLEI